MMTSAQCRAARAWLDISQVELAEGAQVNVSTVRDFETGKRRPIPATLHAMMRFFNYRGIEFSGPYDENGSAGMVWRASDDRLFPMPDLDQIAPDRER